MSFDPKINISDNFTWIEAQCHDGTAIPELLKPNAVKLASQLEIVRAEWGNPISTICWYRTAAHNEALRKAAEAVGRTPGTAKDSQHILAKAIDCRPLKMRDLPAFISCVESLLKRGKLPRIGGWGTYPQWVHLDVRDKPADGHIAFWRGEGVAAEMAA